MKHCNICFIGVTGNVQQRHARFLLPIEMGVISSTLRESITDNISLRLFSRREKNATTAILLVNHFISRYVSLFQGLWMLFTVRYRLPGFHHSPCGTQFQTVFVRILLFRNLHTQRYLQQAESRVLFTSLLESVRLVWSRRWLALGRQLLDTVDARRRVPTRSCPGVSQRSLVSLQSTKHHPTVFWRTIDLLYRSQQRQISLPIHHGDALSQRHVVVALFCKKQVDISHNTTQDEHNSTGWPVLFN